MKNIHVTIYTKETGRLDLTIEEYKNFDFYKVIYHRLDGPAVIYYYTTENVECVFYYNNDQRHRTNGPAIIYYYPDGRVKREYYYINNHPYKKEDYYNLINEMKSLPESLRLTHELWWVREL